LCAGLWDGAFAWLPRFDLNFRYVHDKMVIFSVFVGARNVAPGILCLFLAAPGVDAMSPFS
jgi:hypothetical protein